MNERGDDVLGSAATAPLVEHSYLETTHPDGFGWACSCGLVALGRYSSRSWAKSMWIEHKRTGAPGG